MDLGIGTGIAAFDHAAVGADYWSHDERVRRFGEYVAIVDQLLRGGGNPVSVTGRFYTTTGTRIVPHPPQQPRPPITIGGQSGGVLRIAAATADCWNSDGHPDRSVEEVFAATQRQTARLDDLCVAAGRAPTTLRRSLMLIHALDAWADADALERLVERFWPLGIREFVVFWPGDDRLAALRRAGSIVIPRLKQNLDGSN